MTPSPAALAYHRMTLQLRPDTRLAKTENRRLPTATVRVKRKISEGIDTPVTEIAGEVTCIAIAYETKLSQSNLP